MTALDKLKALFSQFQATFKNAQTRAATDVNDIVLRVSSKSESNTYGWLSQFPSFKKWTGTRTRNALKAQAYVLTNDDYTLDLQIPKNKLDDDTLGLYQPIVENMAVEVSAHDADLVAQALLLGTTSQGRCFDGQPFFSETHPLTFTDEGLPVMTGSTAKFFSNLLIDAANPDAPFWYAADCRKPIRAIVLQDRQAATFISRTVLTDENVYAAREYDFSVDKRCAVGYSIPQLMVASNYPLTTANWEAARRMLQGMVGTDGAKRLGLDASHALVGLEHNSSAENVFTVQFNAAGASNKFFNKVAIKYLPGLE